MNISLFIQELRRRNVIKVATAYAIAGWLIIQVFATIAPQLGFPEWIAPLVTTLVLIGFPLALIFAWAFELTPDGIQKSKEVDITASVTASTGKKLNAIIIVILSMGVIFLLIERVFFAKASILENQIAETELASIAVLPFVNMSSDQENEYFSDGLSEELLNGLARIEGMQVAGRTSSFSFKGKNEDLRIVAEQLGVRHILEGSVRKDGDKLRITAQLIQADNGFHLWSETYDREVISVFAIQEEITRKVVEELKVRLLPQDDITISEHPTEDIEAYNAFLEATQIELNRSPKALEEAIQKYKEAIRLDPTFALAYARLAITYGLSFSYGSDFTDERREEIIELMRENIDQAQLIDNSLGQSYRALGYYFDLSRNYRKSETAYEKAVELLPNSAIAHNGYQIALMQNDKLEESYRMLEKAYYIDPLHPVVARNYSRYLIDIEREFNQGLKIIDQIIENYPDYVPIKADKAWLLRDIPYGRQDEAFTYIFEAYKDDPENFNVLDQLTQIALDVELFSYAEHIMKEHEQTFPNLPFATYRNKIRYYSAKDELSSLITLIDSIATNNEGVVRSNFRFLDFRVNTLNGEYEKGLNYIEETHPSLLLEEPVVADSNIFIAKMYLFQLHNTGNDDRADLIAEQICNDVPQSVEDLEKGQDHSIVYVAQIECHVFQNEMDIAIKKTEELYFDEKSKANWPSIFNNAIEYVLLADNPEFIELKERILADLHSKRDNIITYLKAQGEWREEWEISE